MVETIEIMIEQNHIEQGVPGDCGRCVIALALRDHFEGGYKTACVEEGKGFLTVDDREYVFELPLEANEYVSRFDNGYEVEPCSFTLERC